MGDAGARFPIVRDLRRQAARAPLAPHRYRIRLRALYLLLLFCTGCSSPALPGEPWEQVRPGAVALNLRLPVASLYRIDGDFLFGSANPAIGFAKLEDTGDIVGSFGVAAEVEVFATDAIGLALGVDHRQYDVEGLNPVPQLPVTVEPVKSTQFHAAARYLFRPLSVAPRWRPYTRARLAYLPRANLDLSVGVPGSSPLAIDSASGAFFSLGLEAGMLYQWHARSNLELGLAWELPLNSMFTDLSTEIAGEPIVFEGELRTGGLILFLGISWWP